MEISIKKLNDEAYWHRGTDGAAGMDLMATSRTVSETKVVYGLGVAIAIPEGYVGFLLPRSSIINKGLRLANSVGVIDSDYRGEVKAVFELKDYGPMYLVGEMVCQLVVVPYINFNFTECEELSNTERGEKGFGSTGN